MPVGGVSRGREAAGASPHRLGLDGACPRLGADGSVLGGGIRHRLGRAVAFEAKIVREKNCSLSNCLTEQVSMF